MGAASQWMAVALLCARAAAGAGEAPLTQPPVPEHTGDLVVHAVGDVASPSAIGVQIGNGIAADPSRWPATFVARLGADSCTSTLVGPRALLTAAHCVGTSGRVVLRWRDGDEMVGRCSRTPGWSNADPSHDVALCLLDQEVRRPFMEFENLRLAGDWVATAPQVVLTGFGCTDFRLPAAQPIPALTTGNAVVERSATHLARWPGWLLTRSFRSDGSAYFCPGDSGGAVYTTTGDVRHVVGVASAFMDVRSDPDYGRSYIASLAADRSRTFVLSWLAGHQAQACGVNGYQDQRCRRSLP